MKKKTERKRRKTIKDFKCKFYVMYGFEEADPTNTAYLKISTTNLGIDGEVISGPYSIVSEASCATVFPDINITKSKGFGTPYQWAEFFAEEPELKDWNFHPVPYIS